MTDVEHVHSPSIAKGIAAGLIAGLVGSATKAAGELLYAPRTQGQTPPPIVLTERLAGHPLSPTKRKMAMQGIHHVFGALTGAAYGVAAEIVPVVTTGYGALFGIALQLCTHETMVPLAELDKAARSSHSVSTRVSLLPTFSLESAPKLFAELFGIEFRLESLSKPASHLETPRKEHCGDNCLDIAKRSFRMHLVDCC